jgi:two-component system CheB/CheR fusion protein
LSPPLSLTHDLGAPLPAILVRIRQLTGRDFTQYKKSTILRRIEKRMTQHQIADLGGYAQYLIDHADEVQALFKELLINVTQFFRDADAFAVLRDQVLPRMLADKPADEVLRIWVAGCASGEEAYSVAIVLRECLAASHQQRRVQLYATDLDDDAISVARTGLYPGTIDKDVSPERLRQFFMAEDGHYRVGKEIREMVVFAVQDMVKDPPFTRLDLLCCWNVLIYLEPALQNRLIAAFHYALNPGGVLFLSPSETVGNAVELFTSVHRKWRFYRSVRAERAVRQHQGTFARSLAWTGQGGASLPSTHEENQRFQCGGTHPAHAVARLRAGFRRDRPAWQYRLCPRRYRRLPAPIARRSLPERGRHGPRWASNGIA